MGGHAFEKLDVSIRPVYRADIPSLLKKITELLDIESTDIAPIGSAVYSKKCGDLDLVVNGDKFQKHELHDYLIEQGIEHIRYSGSMISFLYPTAKSDTYIQIDIILGNVNWLSQTLSGEPLESKFKGKHRNILLSSIATAQGYRWSPEYGLSDRDLETDKHDRYYVIETFSNYELVAKTLICEQATAEDIQSVPNIIVALYKYRFRSFSKLTRRSLEAIENDGLTLL